MYGEFYHWEVSNCKQQNCSGKQHLWIIAGYYLNDLHRDWARVTDKGNPLIDFDQDYFGINEEDLSLQLL